jgi:hypothetical protein
MDFKGHSGSVKNLRVSPDGRWLVSGGSGVYESADFAIRLWDLLDGECVSIFPTADTPRCLSPMCPVGDLAITMDNRIIGLRCMQLQLREAIITGVRLWLFGSEDSRGTWDERVTAVCSWCARRLILTDTVIEVIAGVKRAARLSSGQSPCLELPAEAWDDPRLVSACPHCNRPLRFNPFVNDSRGEDGVVPWAKTNS